MMDLPYPTLHINVAAIARNYARLSGKLGAAKCAGVVKANAYGLGVGEVASALWRAGCTEFFVATLEEGMVLRSILPAQAVIYVFHGVRTSEVGDFVANELIPVLNDPVQLQTWNKAGPYALHVDTGMSRLGFTPSQLAGVDGAGCVLLMSHLACANDAGDPLNRWQLEAFRATLARYPGVRASLANSSGIFLGEQYHFDLARPGCSLYGIAPDRSKENPMEPVATLSAPVLQYRVIEHKQSVGYSATASVEKGTVLATVELGYADGFPRLLSNKAHGYAAGVKVPVVGRVSMDMVSIDVTEVPEALRASDLRIEFINNAQPVDVLAQKAGTIGYEIFTRIGNRVRRVYTVR